MTRNNIRTIWDYQWVNSGFEKKYIFQIGEGSGFCAEMVHVLKVVQMCLYNNVQFCLGQTCNPSSYAVNRGWEDYFLPVFPTVKGAWLQTLNRSLFPFGTMPVLKFTSRSILNFTIGKNYYMFDHLPWEFPEKKLKTYMGFKGDRWFIIQQLINSIWRYREDVMQRIKEYKKNTPITSDQQYIGIHIRRGDKIREAPYTRLVQYKKIYDKIGANGMPIFLVTDDASVVNGFCEMMDGSADVYCSANDKMQGYDQKKFNRKTARERWEDTVFFLFELDMIMNSTTFIGSSSSNVFFWVRYNRANEKIFDANCEH